MKRDVLLFASGMACKGSCVQCGQKPHGTGDVPTWVIGKVEWETWWDPVQSISRREGAGSGIVGQLTRDHGRALHYGAVAAVLPCPYPLGGGNESIDPSWRSEFAHPPLGMHTAGLSSSSSAREPEGRAGESASPRLPVQLLRRDRPGSRAASSGGGGFLACPGEREASVTGRRSETLLACPLAPHHSCARLGPAGQYLIRGLPNLEPVWLPRPQRWLKISQDCN